MAPILLCSVVALAIVVERFWTLRTSRITPEGLVMQVWEWAKANQLDDATIRSIQAGSPLGRLLAAGLANRQAPREIMKEAIEEVGRHVVHELERYLNTLGTIASITPLIGLLGTVIGMINTFQLITIFGTGDAKSLSSGISEALMTTALGLVVAIPTLILHGALSRMAKRKLGLLEELSVAFVNGVDVLRGPDSKA